MNRRCAKKVKEELKGSKRFIEGYRKCATTDERHEYHTSYKQNKKEEETETIENDNSEIVE